MKKWRAPQEFIHQEDAGSAHVAVLSVASFEDYKAALQPTFKLTEDQALAATLATTQVSEDTLLDSLQVAAKLSLPTSGTSSTKTENTSEGTTTATSSTTTSKAPGDASGLTPPSPTTTTPPSGKSLADTALGTDPMLKYWAATALYQEAALLSRYVRDAAIGNDFTPYVVRLQISLMPAARNEPYDAYTSVSFFLGDTSATNVQYAKPTAREVQFGEVLSEFSSATSELKSGTPPQKQETLKPLDAAVAKYDAAKLNVTPREALVVVPLLVTDNLESSARSSSLDRIRQQAFSLAFLIQGIAGQGDFVKYSKRLESVFGRDYNSVLTVARVTDNTYRVRLGALQQVGTSLAMVPRTNEATFLLLVPKALTKAQIALTAQTTFVNAKTGRPLEMRSADQVDMVLEDIGDRYCELYGLSYTVRSKPVIEGTMPRCRQRRTQTVDLLKLQAHVQENDVKNFDLDLNASFPYSKRPATFPADSLWVDLANVMVGSRYASTSFELPTSESAKLFDDQTAVVNDDGKKQATVTLRGGEHLVSDKVAAILVTDDNAGMRLFSTTTQVRPGGQDADFVFPSPKALDKKYAGSQHARVEVICRTCKKPVIAANSSAALTLDGVSFPANVIVAKEEEGKKSVFTAKSYVDAIGTDLNHKGTVNLRLELTDAGLIEAAPEPNPGKLKKERIISFEVTGGGVIQVTGAAPPIQGKNSFEVKTDSPVVLQIELASLAPQQPVTIKVQELLPSPKPPPGPVTAESLKPTYIQIAEFHYSVH